jgi:hypothetical protein
MIRYSHERWMGDSPVRNGPLHIFDSKSSRAIDPLECAFNKADGFISSRLFKNMYEYIVYFYVLFNMY